MVRIKVGNQELELADTLRVVYSLKDITGAKNMRDALASIAQLDLDGQLDLLYVAYKARAGVNAMSKENFVGLVLDNLGVFAVTNAVEKLADGLMYAGLSTEEVAEKKLRMEEAGATSSVTDID